MQIYGLCFIEQVVKPIPLQNVIIEANVVDMIAEVTIGQTYKNIEKDTIEALYKFPIHEAATVCRFEAEIDGQRKIKGIVKEAKEAAKEYTEAIQQGHGTYLLESESADIFQCSIGNIKSGQTVVIKITYVTELKHDSESEKIRFVLPTHIAPRYGSSEFSSFSNDGKILKSDILIKMTSVIQNIESPSHKISTEMNIDDNSKISKITLAEQITYLKKDFILVVKSKNLDQPRAFVEYNHETQTNCVWYDLMVVLKSGSMGTEPMKKAAQALELFLRSLPEDCYFNVILFGTHYDSLFLISQLYSEISLSKALNLAQTMTSNYGGTEIFSALKWVFENARNDMPTSVFLITDGGVWNVDQVVELVRENEEKKKDDLHLFSLGIGDFVFHNLVESVARAGKEYSQFVTNNERMDKKIIGMLKNALKPPIKDYKINWTDVDFLESTEQEEIPMEIDKPTISFMNDRTEPPPPPLINIFTNIKIQQAPYNIPPIYPGVRFIVYCILERNIEPCKVITLKATSQDGPMKLDIPLDPVTLQGSKIHKLAARKLIQDLDNKKSFIHEHPKNVGKHIPSSLVKEHIVKLGKTFNLASKYTSFIAIDERNNEIVVSESQIMSQKRSVPSSLFKRKKKYHFSYTISQSVNNQSASSVHDNHVSLNSSSTGHRSRTFSGSQIGYKERERDRDQIRYRKSAKEESLMIVDQMRSSLTDFSKPSMQLQSISSQIGSSSTGFWYTDSFNSTTQSLLQEPKSKVNHKESQIEILFEFLGLQSFDGKFLPNTSFYEFFYKNDLNDFINLKQEIVKELDELSEKEIEEILSNCIAIAYLEIIMFENFKDECEMCYEKVERVLKKMVGIEEKEKIIVEKAKEWIKDWVNSV
ncbi:hypothetical protein C1645_822529 [Glomus cerebriforme]|uniref:von Willebrand factor type A domain-containing protein n=1 Tax=Glomus cerebriforme TaxID=658196 RepID=A0A397T4G8_9GLOM|nr:hypothetical protein C1645_822529 [Glomus cerebriforme]